MWTLVKQTVCSKQLYLCLEGLCMSTGFPPCCKLHTTSEFSVHHCLQHSTDALTTPPHLWRIENKVSDNSAHLWKIENRETSTTSVRNLWGQRTRSLSLSRATSEEDTKSLWQLSHICEDRELGLQLQPCLVEGIFCLPQTWLSLITQPHLYRK